MERACMTTCRRRTRNARDILSLRRPLNDCPSLVLFNLLFAAAPIPKRSASTATFINYGRIAERLPSQFGSTRFKVSTSSPIRTNPTRVAILGEKAYRRTASRKNFFQDCMRKSLDLFPMRFGHDRHRLHAFESCSVAPLSPISVRSITTLRSNHAKATERWVNVEHIVESGSGKNEKNWHRNRQLRSLSPADRVAITRLMTLARDEFAFDERVWSAYLNISSRNLVKHLSLNDYRVLFWRFGLPRARDDPSVSIARLEHMIQDLHTNNIRLPLVATRILIRTHINLGNHTKALALLEDAMERDGIDVGIVLFRRVVSALLANNMSRTVLRVFEGLFRRGVSPSAELYQKLPLALHGLEDSAAAFHWYERLLKDPSIKLEVQLFKEMLAYLTEAGDVPRALRVFEEMGARGHKRDLLVYSWLIHKVGLSGDLSRAEALFEQMQSERIWPNRVIYNSLINAFAKHGDLENANRIFNLMKLHGTTPSVFTYGPLADAFAKRGDTEMVQRLFDHMIESKIRPNEYVFSSLIEVLAIHDDLESAIRVFKQMPGEGVDPNVVTYNLLVRSFIRRGDTDAAWRVFQSMIRAEITPDELTFATLISMYAQRADIEGANYVFRQMRTSGVMPGVHIYCSLINTYARASDLSGVEMIFQEMQANGVRPNINVFNTILNAYAQHGEMDRVLQLHKQMLRMGISPDVYTYCCLMEGYVVRASIDSAMELYESMLSAGVSPNVHVYTVLINGHVRAGNFREAKVLFDRMISQGIQPNYITYAVLIDGYAQHGNYAVARQFLQRLLKDPRAVRDTNNNSSAPAPSSVTPRGGTVNRPQPPAFVFAPLINAYGKRQNTQAARQVFEEMCAAGVVPDIQTYALLMDAYRRGGDLEGVRNLWYTLGGPPPMTNGKKRPPSSSRRSLPSPMVLSIYLDALAAHHCTEDILSTWSTLEQRNFAFDSHNINHYAVALMRCHLVEEACRVVDEKLLGGYSQVNYGVEVGKRGLASPFVPHSTTLDTLAIAFSFLKIGRWPPPPSVPLVRYKNRDDTAFEVDEQTEEEVGHRQVATAERRSKVEEPRPLPYDEAIALWKRIRQQFPRLIEVVEQRMMLKNTPREDGYRMRH
ncbi:uncharacterized protein VTP21DRAFT_1720 [Calcarisporiella thermophila]|uniref:uncharacterized protein n=1 Tax=Calcarisporiella thermophila TaxID=911321 RepID=UPI0037432974